MSEPLPIGKKTLTFTDLTPLIRIATSYAQPAGETSGLSVVGSSSENEPVPSSDTVVAPLKTTALSVSVTVDVGVNEIVPTPAIPLDDTYVPMTVRVTTSSDQLGTEAPFLKKLNAPISLST
jgi:hypothetical protein